MTSVHDVAAALLREIGEMTTMKLQKLAYYCQSWHLARHRSPMFDEEIQAWRQGPVVPLLWREHRSQRKVHEWPLGDPENLGPTERETLDWVARNYGHFSAERLSRMTHRELPWRLARGVLPDEAGSENPIQQSVMAAYFARQQAEPDTAVSQVAASAALEGIELDDEWQAELREVADGNVSADDLVAAEIARAKRRA